MLIPPLDFRCDPRAAEASVSNLSMTLMPTDPAMEAVALLPVDVAAAAPQAMKSSLLEAGVIASIVMPLPWIVDAPVTRALLVALTTLTPTPAPIFVLLSIATAAPRPL